MTAIVGVDVTDVRFPTAAAGDGSDAINRGDYRVGVRTTTSANASAPASGVPKSRMSAAVTDDPHHPEVRRAHRARHRG
jgi:hypothetical protein